MGCESHPWCSDTVWTSKKIVSTFKSHYVLLASLTKSRRSDTQFRAKLPQKSFAFAKVPTTFWCFHYRAWNPLCRKLKVLKKETVPPRAQFTGYCTSLQHKIYDSASLNISVSSGTGIGNISLAIKPREGLEGSLIQRITNVKKSSSSRNIAAPGLLDASAVNPTVPAMCRH